MFMNVAKWNKRMLVAAIAIGAAALLHHGVRL
jgi:hypothetical protein